jgi:hypothetical protein
VEEAFAQKMAAQEDTRKSIIDKIVGDPLAIFDPDEEE